jgi:ankyrin repeat protein
MPDSIATVPNYSLIIPACLTHCIAYNHCESPAMVTGAMLSGKSKGKGGKMRSHVGIAVSLASVLTLAGCAGALHRAAEQNDLARARRLIANGANVNRIELWYHHTPLHPAAKNGNAEMVKLLVDTGADVNTTGYSDYSALHSAVFGQHTEVVKLLLANKADVNAASTNGVTPLYIASQEGHTEVVKLLLANKADVNAKNRFGVTPLFMASDNGHPEVVKLLLAAKADVNAVRKIDGVTPLLMASQNGHTEIVKLLLAAKANVNAKARLGGKDYTPLSVAKRKGHTQIVRLLGADGAREIPTLAPRKTEQLAAVERFKKGWPKLHKGMSAMQVENALGTFPDMPKLGVSAASVDSMRKRVSTSVSGAVHPYAAYKLEFDSSGLSSWKLYPRR